METREKDGLIFTIKRHPKLTHYCGYVTFPKQPLYSSVCDSILDFAPVHGGITYSDIDAKTGAATYGFDCGHWGDDTNPRCTITEWLFDECERMSIAVRIAAKYEHAYNQANDDERYAIIRRYRREVEAYQDKV